MWKRTGKMDEDYMYLPAGLQSGILEKEDSNAIHLNSLKIAALENSKKKRREIINFSYI